MSRMLRKSFLALALSLAAASPAHANWFWWAPVATPDLIVFGDSLSDGGAGVALADALCREPAIGALACGKRRDSVRLGAPYYEGRSFSDGPVAVDVLARLYGKTLTPGYRNPLMPSVSRVGQNYAIAGAHAHGSGFGDMVSLNGQIGAYAHHYKIANPNTIHVILIGGNDLIAAIPHNDKAAVTRAVDAIQSGVEKLAAMGAKRILVYKLLPMHDVPRFAAQPALKANAAALTAQFNAGIDALRTPPGGVTLMRFDMSPMWSVVKQQTWWLRKDYKNACATGTGDVLAHVKASPDANVVISAPWLPTCAPGNRDHRAFFDDLHPSGYLHQMLGQASYDFVYESLNGGQCAVHSWGNDTWPARGQPAVRRGLLGSVHRYDNPYNRQREYFRLVNTGGDGAYWYYPIEKRDNHYWEYIGTTPPKHCGTAFRAAMNLWDARLPSGGVATGDFTRAKRGDRFVYVNPYINQVEYFTFLDPNNNGAFWYFPIDGVSNNRWWARTKFD
ncbi:SGNH/GDSL hydrolase family protein [Lysobacter sp. A6]|uniref:SGNH/GDSL hydrolase family protein n=1 Tax=Noviluteimonas lactosilytica TaxID=2888523 RepID=A0ABS8JJY1_9GAMM|nr:SGNH/GDSL hydrolase family protein [Lysobacter lactosilyticus]MCC8363920.1 SGNH/GDSL hydrolase family protein [Lysobacter lactosilyticus]